MNNAAAEDVTILVNGCDKYKDAWEPFFKLFHIQWKDCPYPFALNTESLDYHGAHSDRVTTIHPGKKDVTWSERLRGCLEKIDTEFILFIVEDYFIQNSVAVDVFEHAHSLMRENRNIGMAALSYGKPNVESGEFEDEYFFSRIINEKNMVWCRINLYRRDYLLKLIRNHETIWEFEKFASHRALKLPYIMLQQKSTVPECFTFRIKIAEGYGISRGKWLPKNVELFDKYGIDVDYDRLGFWEDKPDQPKTEVIKKGAVREALYSVKHGLRQMKKKMKKRLNEYKSKK